jgi:ribonuclease T2
MRTLLALLLMSSLAMAEGERAGDFDYYVLSLSWSPTWCAQVGDGRGAPECGPGRALGWVVHGLWPQNERGWPSYCRTSARDPSRAQTAAMADIMGSGGAAWYQWKKHGRCAGLDATAYFDALRRAYDAIRRPVAFRALDHSVTLPARVVEQAFLRDNPQLSPGGLTVTCKDRRIQEVRLCLDRDLNPRNCSPEVAIDCPLTDALFDPLR